MPISQSNKKTLVISAGDPAGVGAEITLRALAGKFPKNISFIIIGDKSVFLKTKKALKKRSVPSADFRIFADKASLGNTKARVKLLDMGLLSGRDFVYGRPQKNCGQASYRYIKKACALIKEDMACALVTAPINKKSFLLAGIKYPGHTELLKDLTQSKKTAMMFAAGSLRVTLVTIHLPLSKVSRQLKVKDILDAIIFTHRALRKYFGLMRPVIGLCGLNPHASDEGLFGSEEARLIEPAVKKARRKGIKVIGPDAAEAVFYKIYHHQLDAVVAMYHDQGLIPVKMTARDKAVNLTLGLPFIRTSPSTGTAYDIAGKFRASGKSMYEAVKLAAVLAKKT